MTTRTVFLTMALLPLLAPAETPARKPASAAPAAARGNATAQTDAQVEKKFRERFASSKIAGDKFTIRVQGGVATLEGRTNVVQHKGVATRMAKAAGAAQVLNHIQISEEAKQAAAKNLAQGRRRAQVKRSERP
jgi:hypothetical protein